MSETKTNAGSKLYIGTTAQAETLEQFELDSYVEIENVSNVGEFGSSANIVQFPTLGDDFVQKSKGTRNAGDPAIVVGRIPNAVGQAAVAAAEATNFYYNFKYELDNAPSPAHTKTVIYFRALVGGAMGQFGGNEDFTTKTYTLGIYPRPIEVEPELLPSP